MSAGRSHVTFIILTCALVLGCGFDKPIAPDFSNKVSTTITTKEELPKINGEWDGYCQDGLGGPTDKITRLVLGQRCGESTMVLDGDSKKMTFEFEREFFDYYISEDVKSCPANSKHCSCYEYDGKKECTRFSVGKGECTLKVSADVQDTIMVKRDTLLGSSSNRYLRLTNFQSELKYLSAEVENTNLPADKDVPYDFYSNLEKAKVNCESFGRVWVIKNEPVHLVYRLSEDSRRLIFPGKESNPLSFSLFDSPMMAFRK